MSTTTLTPARPGAARRGILWMLLTTLLFVSMDSLAKHLPQPHPVPQVVIETTEGALIQHRLHLVKQLPSACARSICRCWRSAKAACSIVPPTLSCSRSRR